MAKGTAFEASSAPPASTAHQEQAQSLSRRLPALTLAARALANSLHLGTHGRKRAGSGDQFWQFRPFSSGEPAQSIDWRRSARDQALYVREREWNVAHRLWLWTHLSASMRYRSQETLPTKADRAVILALALADAAARAGERVGYLGLTEPLDAHDAIDRIALALATAARQNQGAFEALPSPSLTTLRKRDRCLLIGDFLDEPAAINACLRDLAAQGVQGALLLIADPAEEDFPFHGQTLLYDHIGDHLRIGRAESQQALYLERRAAHRAAVRDIARRHGFQFLSAPTDRPASEALLRLRAALEEDLSCN